MGKRSSLIVLCLVFMVLVAGCISKSEIQNNLIVEAIGIDYNGNNYTVTLSSIDSQKETETYQNTGTTVHQAMENISLDEGKQLLFSSASSLVLGESIEGDSLKNIFWIFSDSKNYNYQMDVFYAPLAADIIKSDSAQKIGTHITNKVVNESSGYFTVKMKFLELLKTFYETENCIYIPVVKENTQEEAVYFDGAVVLKNTNRFLRISQKEFALLKILDKGEVHYTLTIDNRFSVELIGSEVKVKKNDNVIDIQVQLKGSLQETKNFLDISDREQSGEIEAYVKYVLDTLIGKHKLPILSQVKNLGLSQEELKGYRIHAAVTYEEV